MKVCDVEKMNGDDGSHDGRFVRLLTCACREIECLTSTHFHRGTQFTRVLPYPSHHPDCTRQAEDDEEQKEVRVIVTGMEE